MHNLRQKDGHRFATLTSSDVLPSCTHPQAPQVSNFMSAIPSKSAGTAMVPGKVCLRKTCYMHNLRQQDGHRFATLTTLDVLSSCTGPQSRRVSNCMSAIPSNTAGTAMVPGLFCLRKTCYMHNFRQQDAHRFASLTISDVLSSCTDPQAHQVSNFMSSIPSN